MTSSETFTQFVQAINAHDIESIAALMTPNHFFIDSLGNVLVGTAQIRAGWNGYFALCPDYRIVVAQIIAEANVVLAWGEAEGTIDGVAWRTPAAWKAVVRDGAVTEWRVFADNKPVYEILAKRSG